MNSNINRATILTPSKPLSSLNEGFSSASTEVSKPFYFTWTFWIIIIVILAYFGYNIFNYFAKGTQYVSNILGPLIKIIFALVGQTATQTASSAATGSEYISGKVKDTSAKISQNLDTDLESSPKKQDDGDENLQDEYVADASISSTQQSKVASKAGWCYIGEERGIKNCIQVNKYDICESGIVTNERCY